MNKIKRIAMQLIERYNGLFTTDFEANKQLLNRVAVFHSKELRNEVAGYITRYMMRQQGAVVEQHGEEQVQIQERDDQG